MVGTNKKFTALNLPLETVAILKEIQLKMSLKKGVRITYEEILKEALETYSKRHKLNR